MNRSERNWLYVPEVAWLLQRSERRVRELVRTGDLRAAEPQVGNAVRIPVTAVADKLQLRAAWWLGELLAGRVAAPRADRPWRLPPSLPPCSVTPH